MDTNKVSLGKKTDYKSSYNREALFFPSRQEKRDELGYNNGVDFKGYDIWNAYEVSYLNEKGKPQVRIGQLIYDAASENIVESKSLKLYLNGFNMEKISSDDKLQNIIEADLKEGIKTDNLTFRLYSTNNVIGRSSIKLFTIDSETNKESYKRLDSIDTTIDTYSYNSGLLEPIDVGRSAKEVKLYSDLLKSNCLVTHQPDWGSVFIKYMPNDKKISEESLLKYIVSFREHNEFHEQCCERIFHDLDKAIEPKALSVFCKYTRRGGIDINPYRVKDENNLLTNIKKYTIFNREVRQ